MVKNMQINRELQEGGGSSTRSTISVTVTLLLLSHFTSDIRPELIAWEGHETLLLRWRGWRSWPKRIVIVARKV